MARWFNKMHFFFILDALHFPGIPGFIEDGTLFSSPVLLYAVEVADIISLNRADGEIIWQGLG